MNCSGVHCCHKAGPISYVQHDHFELTPSISLHFEAVSYLFTEFKKHTNINHLIPMYIMKIMCIFHICNACNVCEHLQIVSNSSRGADINCKVE